jgi:hypothetical protein
MRRPLSRYFQKGIAARPDEQQPRMRVRHFSVRKALRCTTSGLACAATIGDMPLPPLLLWPAPPPIGEADRLVGDSLAAESEVCPCTGDMPVYALLLLEYSAPAPEVPVLAGLCPLKLPRTAGATGPPSPLLPPSAAQSAMARLSSRR